MQVIKFLAANWDSVAAVVACAAGLLVAAKRGYAKYVSEILFYLVTEAESKFGGGTGALKYAAVTTWIYDRLPKVVCLFFSAAQLDRMIEEAVDEMQKYLTANRAASALVVGGGVEVTE